MYLARKLTHRFRDCNLAPIIILKLTKMIIITEIKFVLQTSKVQTNYQLQSLSPFGSLAIVYRFTYFEATRGYVTYFSHWRG